MPVLLGLKFRRRGITQELETPDLGNEVGLSGREALGLEMALMLETTQEDNHHEMLTNKSHTP